MSQAMATGRVQGAGHAGCFVRRGNQMLAVRLTYDGHWDIVGHDFSVCWCLMFVVVVVVDDDDDDDKIHNVGHHGAFFLEMLTMLSQKIVALWGRKYDIPGGVLASSNWITLRSTNMPDWKITILNRRYIIPLQIVGFSIFLWIFRSTRISQQLGVSRIFRGSLK